jgi:hypothetical protein
LLATYNIRKYATIMLRARTSLLSRMGCKTLWSDKCGGDNYCLGLFVTLRDLTLSCVLFLFNCITLHNCKNCALSVSCFVFIKLSKGVEFQVNTETYSKFVSFLSSSIGCFLGNTEIKRKFTLCVGLTWREEHLTLPAECELAKELTVYRGRNWKIVDEWVNNTT